MEGKDNIKELFSQKLGNFEAKVNPELWAKISTQVAAGATTTVATGLSVFAKVAIGIGVSAAAITTVVLLSTSSEATVSENPSTEVQTNTPKSTTVETKEIAEIQAQKTVQSQSNTIELNNELNTVTTPYPAAPTSAITTPSTQEITQTPQLPITGMLPIQPKSVSDETSEPQIVEGVSYLGMTNYGGKPANEPEIAPEISSPKAEPIERFVNVFTPNGDNENDVFSLKSEGLSDFSVVVFDPKGEIVFQSNDPDFTWDGRDIRSGEMVASGNYMYMVSAYDSEGNPYPIYERLTIIAR